MPKIVIQAGHQNIQYNSLLSLRRSTGAPNEMAFNIDIRDKVSDELRKRGFEVIGTDANANDDPKLTAPNDFDLFLAIHYDADVYQTGGGFVDFPEPSTDAVTEWSQTISRVIGEEYFKTTGIEQRQERSNKNTRYYYMWKYISAKTPCVLIECGVGMHVPNDWKTLHFNRAVVVEGLVRGICKAFGINYEVAVPPTQQPSEIDSLKKQVFDLTEENKSLKNALSIAETAHKQELAQLQTECQEKQTAYKLQIKQELVKTINAY